MNPITRRSFLRSLAAGTLAPLAGFGDVPATTPSPPRPRARIGAIRWDAWYDPADGKVARYVEKSLGPAEFHYRMPFFGQVTGPDSVRINGDWQDIMDAEIGFAAGAGLAYWAYCTYGADDPLSNALALHLSSARRREIDFCLIIGAMSLIPYFAAQTARIVGLMLEPGYATVLDGRPLFFILSPSDAQIAHLGGLAQVAAWTAHVRGELQRGGQGNPYFVLSDGSPARAAKLCHELDFDAVGLYASCLGPFGGAPYAMLAQATEKEWDHLATSGLPVVPNIMTGWDTRPRLRNPTPWDHKPGSKPPDPTHYYQPATPAEIARHTGDALRWIAAHPAVTPANTGLIYAWDECDEGFGALVPSYRADNPRGDDARLRALGPVLCGAG